MFNTKQIVFNITSFLYLCSKTKRMYTVSELVEMGNAASHDQMWNQQIACLLVDHLDLKAHASMEGASVFAFILVKKGNLIIKYNGQTTELKKNDMQTYAPGVQTETVHVSTDYEAFCLLIDEKLISETPLMHHFIKAAYFPIAEFSKPQITLTDEQAAQMSNLLTMLRQHIMQPSAFQREALLALCEVISIDLLNIQNILVEHQRVTTRAENIFTAFLQLIPANFVQHHDLQFYADQLNISTTYLSRIIKQFSGRTVMSFIEYALATEAARRLKSTDKSISQLAFDFHFADQASFTKFFTRIKGISPREFRNTKIRM